MDTVTFRLFGDAGFINPTPWPVAYGLSVWDGDSGQWRGKQTRDFDGGWRWFDKYDVAAMVIYNVRLHRQAHYVLAHQDIEDTCVDGEFILLCAKSHVLLEHNLLTARDWVIDKIQADFRKLRGELLPMRLQSVKQKGSSICRG